MTRETTDQIKQSIREIEKQIEESRAERVAKGLPPDPPPRFVPLPMAWAILRRLDPLIQFATKYAAICDGANEVIAISDEQLAWIKTHETDVRLVNNAREDLLLLAIGVDGIYSVLTAHSEFETAGELLRKLVRYITNARPTPGQIDAIVYDHNATAEENRKAFRKVSAEIERLKDEDYFNGEYRKVVEQYKEGETK